MRAREESAEAIVVKTLAETPEEQRAEEPRESHRPTVAHGKGEQVNETQRALQYRQPPVWVPESPGGGSLHWTEGMFTESRVRRKGVSVDAQ